MGYLRSLKEITELEILLTHRSFSTLDSIKSMAIQILKASECHKDCVCNHQCGCAETNECHRCRPTKRFLRIGKCPGTPCGKINKECRSEEIQVSSGGIVFAK